MKDLLRSFLLHGIHILCFPNLKIKRNLLEWSYISPQVNNNLLVPDRVLFLKVPEATC